MSKAKFTSNRTVFEDKHQAFVDLLLGRVAQNIEVNIKSRAGTPVKTGQMKSMVRHYRSGTGQFKVAADAEYSAVQELGRRAGAATFRNYTTAGTSAGWFGRAIMMAIRNREQFAIEAARAVGL